MAATGTKEGNERVMKEGGWERVTKDGCDWDTKGSQAWLLLKQEDEERGRWVEDGAAGANYSLLGIAEVVKSGYLCTRKNENISNYE